MPEPLSSLHQCKQDIAQGMGYLAQCLAHGRPKEIFIDCYIYPNMLASQNLLSCFLKFPSIELFMCQALSRGLYNYQLN